MRAPGKGDLIVCSPDSTANFIVADRSDRIAPSCRAANATFRYASAPAAHDAQVSISGDGSDDRPFHAPCNSVSGSDCPVTFPARTLRGLWANESVPAYQCPFEFPFLLSQNYAPWGTSLPPGLEVRGLGPIGVAIVGWRSIFTDDGKTTYLAGTFRNKAFGGSATSWSTGTNPYQVVLHCTSDVNRAVPTSGGGRIL